jgi:hypothetical protein
VEGENNAKIDLKKGANTASITYDGTNLVFSNGLHLPAGQTVNYNGIADWRLIDTDDFETDVEGWICHDGIYDANVVQFQRIQLNTNSANPLSNSHVLRAHINGNDALKKQLNLTGIPHTHVKVVFTYHFLDSWDGDAQNEMGFAGFALTATPSAANFINSWTERELQGAGNDYWTGALQNTLLTTANALKWSSKIRATTFGLSSVQIWERLHSMKVSPLITSKSG